MKRSAAKAGGKSETPLRPGANPGRLSRGQRMRHSLPCPLGGSCVPGSAPLVVPGVPHWETGAVQEVSAESKELKECFGKPSERKTKDQSLVVTRHICRQ
uniref:Uncharacterized protein n=1 Tax=Sphaerodactylus townsendi TaxID=933632 RepID=A0ACB8G3L4_9SAUR